MREAAAMEVSARNFLIFRLSMIYPAIFETMERQFNLNIADYAQVKVT